MPKPTDDDIKRAGENQDNAIAKLIAGVGRKKPRAKNGGDKPRYGKRVYEAGWDLMRAFQEFDFVYNYRFDDLEEYKAEVERRRQIGLTIDPDTAVTMFWWADINDPYQILNRTYHEGCIGRERFARRPDATSQDDWVDFNDLPEATREALWKRDGRKLSFPYCLHKEDDILNYPPAKEKGNAK